MNIGILGGGLAGVSLQKFLKCKSEILEKEDRLGGLCRSFNKDGFRYDIGGHILFSKDKNMMGLIRKALGANINHCRRNNKILFKGKFIKYPFENGLGALDKRDIYECLTGYLNNNYRLSKNFESWIYATFGRGIAEKYLVPYNEKIWKFPLDKMGIEWVERIPKPPVEDVIKSALGIETEGYTHQLYFDYPYSGGIEGLIKAFVTNKAKITTGFEIRRIEKMGAGWLVSDGINEKHYDRLISTIPVDLAVKCIKKAPESVRKAAAGLRHNAVKIVLIGVKNNSFCDKSAIYVADRKVLAHRICFMKYFSPKNVPTGMSSVIAEISMPKNSNLYRMHDNAVIKRVIGDFMSLRLIKDKRDIVATDIKTIDYGYVVYDVAYKKNISIVRDYFSGLGIELLGRFGEFEYINMDETIRRSVNLAKRLNGE